MLRAAVDRYFQRAGSPSTTVSPVRQCADVWRKTTSRPGATTCGAFRRSMGSTLPAWRTCSTSMPKRPIRSARWSVSTRAQPSSSARSASRSRAERGQLERYDCEYKRNGTANLLISSTCESASNVEPRSYRRTPLSSGRFSGNSWGHDWTPIKSCENLQFCC